MPEYLVQRSNTFRCAIMRGPSSCREQIGEVVAIGGNTKQVMACLAGALR